MKFRYYIYERGFGNAFSRKQHLKLRGIHLTGQGSFIGKGGEFWKFFIIDGKAALYADIQVISEENLTTAMRVSSEA